MIDYSLLLLEHQSIIHLLFEAIAAMATDKVLRPRNYLTTRTHRTYYGDDWAGWSTLPILRSLLNVTARNSYAMLMY